MRDGEQKHGDTTENMSERPCAHAPVRPRTSWSECVATFCWLGKLPVASGTWGSLGAAVVHALVAWQLETATHPCFLPALAALFTVACIAYGPWAERFYGKKDPGPVVIDEVAGYFLAVSFFPNSPQLLVGVLVFFLFRIFDIIKPFPAGRSQRLPAGWGIVADDLIAGLYAALFTWLVMLAFFG